MGNVVLFTDSVFLVCRAERTPWIFLLQKMGDAGNIKAIIMLSTLFCEQMTPNDKILLFFVQAYQEKVEVPYKEIRRFIDQKKSFYKKLACDVDQIRYAESWITICRYKFILQI